MTREKSIIFSDEMVKAILEGKKTQTRRVIKPQPTFEPGEPNFCFWKDCQWAKGGLGFPSSGIEDHAPYRVGDLLWVREKFRLIDFEYVDDDWNASVEHADGIRGARLHYLKHGADEKTGWRSPIHMPREASRITLKVTDVRAELLQEISIKDCLSEGIKEIHGMRSEIQNWYSELWDSINAKRGYEWNSNPWVWVIQFERVEP